MTSAHQWFPNLPGNWEIARLGACFEQVRETVNEELGIVTVFRDGEVTLRSNRRSEGYTEATDYSLYQVIKPGHLAIHNMDAFAGAVGVSDSHGMCSPVVTVCRPKTNVNAKYYSWVLREMARSGWIEANAKSVRERTSEFRWPMAKSQLVPLPPREEQDAIVEFLERELEQIDKLISKELRLVDVLSDFWFASIRFAVTGGLQSQEPKKPSHLNWIGEIPRDWKISKIKRSWQITSGKMLNQSAEQVGKVLPYLTTASIQDDGLNLNDPNEMHFTPAEVADYSLRKGDVLVVEGGAIGKSAVLEGDLAGWGYQNHVLRLRPRDSSNAKFLDYYLKHLREIGHFDSLSAFATIPNLSASKLGAVAWPVVPEADADVIVNYLEKLRLSISRLTKDANQMVSLLQERRSALISDAITGKLQLWGA